MQSWQLLVCVAMRESWSNHHIWHTTLKYYIHLNEELCLYFNTLLSYLSSIKYYVNITFWALCSCLWKSFKRLGTQLVCSLACGSYYMPHRADTGSNLSESADHGTHPKLRSSLCNIPFCVHHVTVRGEAVDNPPMWTVLMMKIMLWSMRMMRFQAMASLWQGCPHQCKWRWGRSWCWCFGLVSETIIATR